MDTSATVSPAVQHAQSGDTPADACQMLWQQLQHLVQSREAKLSAQEQEVQHKAHQYQQIEHLLSSLWQHVHSLTSHGLVAPPSLAGQQPEEVTVQLLKQLLLQAATPRTYSKQQPHSYPHISAAAATHPGAVGPDQLHSDPQQQQTTAAQDDPALIHNRSQAAGQTANEDAAETLLGQQDSGAPAVDDAALLRQRRILSRLSTLGGKLRIEEQQLRSLQHQMAADLQQAHYFAAFLQSDADVAEKFQAWKDQQGLVAAPPQGEHQHHMNHVHQEQQQVPRCCSCGGLQQQPAGKHWTHPGAGAGAGSKKNNKKRKNLEPQQVQQQERAQGKPCKKQKGPKHKQQPPVANGFVKNHKGDGAAEAAHKRASRGGVDSCTAAAAAHTRSEVHADQAATAPAVAADAYQAKAVESAEVDVLGHLYELQEQQSDPAVDGSGACQHQQPLEAAAAMVEGKRGEQQQQQQQQVANGNTASITTTPETASPAAAASPVAEHASSAKPQVLLATDHDAPDANAQIPGAIDSVAAAVASTEVQPDTAEHAEAKAHPKQHLFKPTVPRVRRPAAVEDQQPAAAADPHLAAVAAAGLNVCDAAAAADEIDDPFENMDPEERVAALGERGAAPANFHAAEDKRRRQKQYFVHGARRAGDADSGQQQQQQQQQGEQIGLQGPGQTLDSPTPIQRQVWQQGIGSDGKLLTEQRQQQHQHVMQQFSHFGQQAAAAVSQQQHQVCQLQLPGKPWLQPLQQQQQQQHYPQHNHQFQQQQRAAHKKHGSFNHHQQQQRTDYRPTSHQQQEHLQQQQKAQAQQQRHHPTKHALPMGAASVLGTRRHQTQHGTQPTAAANGGGFGVGLSRYGRAREEDASEQELAAMVEELRQAAG